jgi:tetratricopeptide (TPR) repeat protein
VLSWQTTVVGDPLYRPFAENPDQLQDRLLQQQSPLLEWAFLRLINVNFAAGKPLTQCIEVLESMEPVKTSSVLAEKLADLYAAQGKPSSAAHQYAKALQLKASPQQRLRMLLTLGDKLIALNRDADAMQAFQLLLKENPDYPDKPAIYRRLLPLAQNLKQTNEVEKYQALLRPPDSAAPATK